MKLISFSPSFVKKLKDMARTDTRLVKKIEKQLVLFQTNPKHPSLRLHKLKGNFQEVWSVSVTKSFRLVYEDGEQYYFFDLGEHDQMYR